MSEISDHIRAKLKKYPQNVGHLAIAAIEASESGMAENSLADYLENIIRQIVRKKGAE